MVSKFCNKILDYDPKGQESTPMHYSQGQGQRRFTAATPAVENQNFIVILLKQRIHSITKNIEWATLVVSVNVFFFRNGRKTRPEC